MSICNLSILNPSHFKGASNLERCVMTVRLVNWVLNAETITSGNANRSTAYNRYCQSLQMKPSSNALKNKLLIKGENTICIRARKVTNPKMNASVFKGDGDPIPRIINVNKLTSICHSARVTTQSEIKIKAVEKKIVHRSQGSISLVSKSLCESLSAKVKFLLIR